MSEFHSQDKIERLRKLEAGEAIILKDGSKQQLGKYYSRPQPGYGDIWCNCCQKPADFAHTCAHSAGNPARSRLYIQASCHGETADILMNFQQWHENEGKKIIAFEGVALPEPVTQPVVIQELPKLLLLKDKAADSEA